MVQVRVRRMLAACGAAMLLSAAGVACGSDDDKGPAVQDSVENPAVSGDRVADARDELERQGDIAERQRDDADEFEDDRSDDGEDHFDAGDDEYGGDENEADENE